MGHLHTRQQSEPAEGTSIPPLGRPTTMTAVDGSTNEITNIVHTNICAAFTDIVRTKIHATITNILPTNIYVASD